MLRMSVILLSLLVLLTACSSPAPKAADTAPASPASTTGNTAASAQPATPAPAPAQSATTTPAGGKKYTLVAEQSRASYIVTELLAGATVRNQAIGTTSKVTGELVLDSQGKVQPGTYTVDLVSLTSDRGNRDMYIRSNGLESSKYPTATFNLKEVKGSPTFAPGAKESFELIGTMKIRQTEKNVSWKATSTVEGGLIKWAATLETKLTDWGINPPVLLVRSVAEIDDPFKIEVHLTFKPAN